MQGSYDRREVVTRHVEYVIDTPEGESVEAKTLGIVLANVHRELGNRVQYDDAYQVQGRDGAVVISFTLETQDGLTLRAGDPVLVRLSEGGFIGLVAEFNDGLTIVRKESE